MTMSRALELLRRLSVSTCIIQPTGDQLMMKTRLLIGALAIAGLVGSTFAADAKSHKHSKHPSSTTSGANMKSEKGNAANPSSQGDVGSGTTNNNGPASGGK
jgi:hypothetical protein